MAKAQRQHLTELAIENLEATGQRYVVWDDDPQNLSVVVTTTGYRSYYLIKRANGQTVYHKICVVGEMPLKDVRKRAYELNGELARGNDINQRRQLVRKCLTLKQTFEWLLEDLKDSKRTWKTDEYFFNKYLEPFHNKKLTAISVDSLRQFFKKLQRDIETNNKHRPGRTNKRGIPLCNRLRCILHAIFQKAKNDLEIFVGDNPIKRIKLQKEQPRERYLTESQQTQFLEESKKEGEHIYDLFYLMLNLGQRLFNNVSMRWDEIDMENKTWTIPHNKMKTKKTHTVPLTENCIELLKRRKQQTGDSPWVFPSPSGQRKGNHLFSPKQPFFRVLKRCGITDLRLHDLRHSAASNLYRAGASLHVISLVLGHSNLLQSSRYTHLCVDAQREFINKVGQKLA